MELNNRVEGLIEARRLTLEGLAPIMEMLKDREIPLDERWAAYTQLVNNHILINIEPYGDGYLDNLGPNFTLYDDFNADRYQDVTYTEMYDVIMDSDETYKQEFHALKDSNVLKEWQEQVLELGFSGFTYDW